MNKHKSARGKPVDMSALAKQHEAERAVSNVPVNARGDIIDSRGKVKVTREKIKQEYYKNSVPGASERVSIKEDTVQRKAISPKEQKEILDEMSAVNQEIDNAMGNTDENPMVRDHNKEVKRTKRKRKGGGEYFEVEWADGSITEEDA